MEILEPQPSPTNHPVIGLFQFASELCWSCVLVLVASLFLCLALMRIIYILWWKPVRIQKMMAAQGIYGPPYRFIHGSTKEMMKLRQQATERPMELSHDVFPLLQPHIQAWINGYGPNYLNWVGTLPELIITDPELIKEVLNNKEKCYQKTKSLGFFKRLLGDGLVTSEGEKWVKLRKLANHAFHGESLKSSLPAMVDSVHMMLDKWRDYEGKEIEVFEEFIFLTSDVISRTAFGSSYMEGRKIFEMLKELAVLTSTNSHQMRFPGLRKIWRTSDEMKGDELVKGIHDAVTELIEKREAKVSDGDEDGLGNDFLGLLVRVYLEEDSSKRITIYDVVDECKTFYFAGQETTNTLLTWTVFLLAVHTEWQEEARKEVLQVFGSQDPYHDGLMKLKTMTMIINESLRLYSPVISMSREVSRQARLGKLVLPANLHIFVANLKVHHNPQVWGEDVHLFKPERFSEGVAKATNNNPAAFLPFGMGPRNCAGMNFALAEAKIALSMILQRYSFTLSPAYVHSPIQVLTTRPQHGVHVILHSLHN